MAMKLNIRKHQLPYTHGSPDAPIALVGEGLSIADLKANKPFMSMSDARQLDNWFRAAQLWNVPRYETVVFKDSKVFNPKKITKDEKVKWYDLLHRELAETKANIIIAVGEFALDALIGHSNITARRGFMHVIPAGPLKGRKVMPVLAPYRVATQAYWASVCTADIEKAGQELHKSNVSYDYYRLITGPTFAQVKKYILDCLKNSDEVAVDIEGRGSITAISLCYDEHLAISVPFEVAGGESYWTPEEEVKITLLLSRVLNECNIIGQNFLYDAYHLHHFGFLNAKDKLWTNLTFDTLSAHIAAGYGEMPHNLEFLTSVYCNLPYWKEDGKDWKLQAKDRDAKDLELFWRYSALDALATFKVAQKLKKELDDADTWQIFQHFYVELTPHLLQISLRGIAVDEEERTRIRKKLVAELRAAEKQLPLLNGEPLNVKSPKQKLEFLRYYGIKAANTDAKTLKKLQNNKQVPQFIRDNLTAIETVTKLRDMVSRYLVAPLGHAGRFNFSLKPTTKTGRLASSKDPFGNGFNSQNIMEVMRGMFVPDPGHVLVYADLKNAENRIVADLSGCIKMINMFRSGDDFHCLNAAELFDLDPVKFVSDYLAGDKEAKTVRKRGKMSSHAYNYDVGKFTLADQAGVSVAEATRFLNLLTTKYPEIRAWHEKLKLQLRHSRQLMNPFGRLRFFFDEFNIKLYHEAYAQIPQSTVPDIINAGMIKINEKYQVLTQVHDAVLFQCLPEELDDAIALCDKVMREPLEGYALQAKLKNDPSIPILTLEIPVDYEVSLENWRDVKKLYEYRKGFTN